jgi:hypothetical protein
MTTTVEGAKQRAAREVTSFLSTELQTRYKTSDEAIAKLAQYILDKPWHNAVTQFVFKNEATQITVQIGPEGHLIGYRYEGPSNRQFEIGIIRRG